MAHSTCLTVIRACFHNVLVPYLMKSLRMSLRSSPSVFSTLAKNICSTRHHRGPSAEALCVAENTHHCTAAIRYTSLCFTNLSCCIDSQAHVHVHASNNWKRQFKKPWSDLLCLQYVWTYNETNVTLDESRDTYLPRQGLGSYWV